MPEKHRSGHLVTRGTFGRKPLEITTFLNILQQYFRTIEFLGGGLTVHFQ